MVIVVIELYYFIEKAKAIHIHNQCLPLNPLNQPQLILIGPSTPNLFNQVPHTYFIIYF